MLGVEVRRSFGDSFQRRTAAALALAAVMAATVPHVALANDQAGLFGLIRQKLRERSSFASPVSAPAPAVVRSLRNGDNDFRHAVRSYAPEPRLQDDRRFSRPPLPVAIVHGYAPRGGEPIRVIDRTGAQVPAPGARIISVDAARQSQPRRTVCVRLCDGYYFPVGNLDSSSELPAHESMCRAACPAAPTALFTLDAGAPIEQAAHGDRTYASLPVAFRYRTSRAPACACQSVDDPTRLSALRDMTLRPGDAVVTGQRASVFNGAQVWPYRASDFTDFQTSRRLNQSQRAKVDSLLGVTYAENLLKPFNVARAGAPPAAEVEVVRPQHSTQIVRRIDDPAEPAPTQRGVFELTASSRGLQVVDRRQAPGFVVR